MKRLTAVLVVLTLVVLALPRGNARGQGDDDLRATVSALEARVSRLESIIDRELTGSPTVAAEIKGHVLSGTISVPTKIATTYGKECTTGKDSDYNDIREGRTLPVKDETGTVIGRAVLRQGFASGPPTYKGSTATNACLFTFLIDEVPIVKFYTVALGRHGELTYSLADLETMRWSLALTFE